MKKTMLFVGALLALAAWTLRAEMNVEVKTDRADAIYKCGDKITISAQVLGDDGKPASGWKVKYELLADGGVRKTGEYVSDAQKPFTLETTLPKPGALRAEFIVYDANGKTIPVKRRMDQWTMVSGRVGAVAEPEKLQPVIGRPADFAEFWAKQRAEVDAVPIKVLEKKFLSQVYGIDVYDVKVSCCGKRPVSGYLGIPHGAAPKSLPVMVYYQGAGVGSCGYSNVVRWGQKGFAVFDINAHGIENGQPAKFYQDLRNGELNSYYYKFYNSKEEHYFRGIIQRVIRSLEYVKTLPEWNGKDIVVHGGSQGGYQSLIAAALDPQVTLCYANVPAFAEFAGQFFGDPKRMSRFHFGQALAKLRKDDAFNRKALIEYSYLDPVSFAPDIKCPVYITFGFCDLSSPTTSIYTIFNQLPEGKKYLKGFPNGIHSTSGSFPEADAALKAISGK